jgi:flavin reductase (DIM6/NTAB) family NADH-FMN oxidoreductase RutF
MIDQLKGFKAIDPFSLKENVFDMLQDEWMLITAGDENEYNTMTAAWGSLGILWRKPIAVIYIRPQRYTYKFTEKHNRFTLSFFGHNNHREALSFCGTKTGRDFDKAKETGLTPAYTQGGNIAFQEARLIFDCRKIYADDIKPEHFIDSTLDTSIYPTKDYHRFYIGEIEGCFEIND